MGAFIFLFLLTLLISFMIIFFRTFLYLWAAKIRQGRRMAGILRKAMESSKDPKELIRDASLTVLRLAEQGSDLEGTPIHRVIPKIVESKDRLLDELQQMVDRSPEDPRK